MLRSDFNIISQILRTTPLDNNTRNELVQAFVESLNDQGGFDVDLFTRECTRGARPGEHETYELPDSWVNIRPGDLMHFINKSDWPEADRILMQQAAPHHVIAALAEGGAMYAVAQRDLARSVMRRATTALASIVRKPQRDRTPGAWVVSDEDPEAPYGPFPDTADKTAKQNAQQFLDGLTGLPAPHSAYKVVYRK